ncbi:hypothetical protein HED22_10205 [Thalassospira sp. HF15]|uniref:hypothetical protein n=1 Tax=Thalassospira sp. HF15 TaxID=2722755 RepID=UPI0014307A5D|nr:hypothetical protein [Thalassospira sp. HF15]NIY76016.1 hypothetical protein [Thalassospira sp. HF15]
MIGKTRIEKRRFWIALLFAGIVSSSWGTFGKSWFYSVPSTLAFDEFSKRCLANIDDFNGLEADLILRPYKMDAETLPQWMKDIGGSVWRYAHIEHEDVEVTLMALENVLCSVHLEGVDFKEQNTALVNNLPLVPVQYPEGHENVEEYLLQFNSASEVKARVAIEGVPEEGNIGVFVLLDGGAKGISSGLGDVLYGSPPEDLLYQEFARLCIDHVGKWDQLIENPLLSGQAMTEGEIKRIGPAVLRGWVYSVPPFKHMKISLILDNTGVCTVHGSGKNIGANIKALNQHQRVTQLAVKMPTEEGQALRLESDTVPGGVALVMTMPGRTSDTGEPSLVMSIQSEQDFKNTEGYSIRALKTRGSD